MLDIPRTKQLRSGARGGTRHGRFHHPGTFMAAFLRDLDVVTRDA
jgi:hypothetical protein